MPKKQAPKISPEELLEVLRQEESRRYDEEQERLHAKADQDLKEYKQRRVQLIDTSKFFSKLEKVASDNRVLLSATKEWDNFLACRQSANSKTVPELREYLFRWTHQQEMHEKGYIGCAFASDELSMPFLANVQEALSVLESIEDESVSGRKEEVMLLQDEIRKFIVHSIDKMTVQIGSNVNRNMKTQTPLMSEFCLREIGVLSMFLWSFRHVPLPKDYNLLVDVIAMNVLGLTINLPLALDLKQSLIRGLWLDFDHFSSQDPTKNISLPDSSPELLVTHEIEWTERQKVRSKRLAAMRTLREEYDAKERVKQAESEALLIKAPKSVPKPGKDTTNSTQTKKGKKKGKQTLEPESVPPIITEETDIDIDIEYEREESERFWASLVSVKPGSLPLQAGYLNLREFSIVGGVYEVIRFDTLPQPVEQRPDLMFANLTEGLHLSKKPYRAVGDEDAIEIQLQLPTTCCWWEQPTVCCWEPWEESEHFSQLRPEVQRYQFEYAAIEAHKASLLFAAPNNVSSLFSEPKTMLDFDLQNIPMEVRLHFLIRDHILPRLPEGYRFRAELKRLFSVLTSRAECLAARTREQMARNGMMLTYSQFVEANSLPGGLSKMRHPDSSDIAVEAERLCDERHGDTEGTGSVKLEEMEERLQQLSLTSSDTPRYMHPPRPICRSVVFTETDTSETSLNELELEMDELVLALESVDSMLDDEANERLCKVFSTFLELLEYLHKMEIPQFPSLRLEVPSHEMSQAPVKKLVKEFKRRFIDIRPTKKYPLGLGTRARSISRNSAVSVALEGKKKVKRKSTPVRKKSSTQPPAILPAPSTSETHPEALVLIEHTAGRWSQKPIRRQSYDANQRLLTFWTDRLGTFGLAARKYVHLPFTHWTMRRHGRVAQLTTIITLHSRTAEILFYVSPHGYRVDVLDRSRKTENTRDDCDVRSAPAAGWFSLKELEKYLLKINVHVFPQIDTCFYTAGCATGSGSHALPKHDAMEQHNLRCLGAFCLTHNLQRCVWNEFANRRTALVLARQSIEGRHEPDFQTIMITPLKSQLVEVEELCSSALEKVLLAFHPRPADQSYNADCYGLLKDSLEEPSRKVLAKTPPLLQWHVGQLLQKLRLLSYS